MAQLSSAKPVSRWTIPKSLTTHATQIKTFIADDAVQLISVMDCEVHQKVVLLVHPILGRTQLRRKEYRFGAMSRTVWMLLSLRLRQIDVFLLVGK